MKAHIIEIDGDGNFTLPTEILDEMNLQEGDVLYLEPRPPGFALIPASDYDTSDRETPPEKAPDGT